MAVEHLPVIQRVRDRPARRTVIVLGDRVHRVRLGVFERCRREAGELTLEKVEGELAADRKGRHHGEAAEHIADPAVVGIAVEAARPRILERIGVVAESRRFTRREVAADVVDRNDGLHQDILPDDVAFAECVVVETAVGLITRHRDVFAQRELVDVECGVDAPRCNWLYAAVPLCRR